MDAVFVSLGNSKINEPHILSMNLSDEIDLKEPRYFLHRE